MSMAAGEYVSVSSQLDTERADLERERRELESNDAFERRELAAIYIGRGLDQDLAAQVADQLMAHDALGAHARDELGLVEMHAARPVQAALTSAVTFAAGAALPMLIAWFAPLTTIIPAVASGSLVCLVLLGGLAARAGGAGVVMGVWRVTFWGALAMAATAGVGWCRPRDTPRPFRLCPARRESGRDPAFSQSQPDPRLGYGARAKGVEDLIRTQVRSSGKRQGRSVPETAGSLRCLTGDTLEPWLRLPFASSETTAVGSLTASEVARS
jgi:VIT1/CCC1 family predicted Fe2+/Mn2+ transporter